MAVICGKCGGLYEKDWLYCRHVRPVGFANRSLKSSSYPCGWKPPEQRSKGCPRSHQSPSA